ncbi:MAG: bifunctional hydroxymethylpyrimidine kinase/phosphomethylpyrimidine kinase [Bacteroidaceae bacterium]|nr:bifunctional hydroxymethylpyrimidine kinase/phosphomethylpyrimidine kinase [Bacteroidaceae bacterium]
MRKATPILSISGSDSTGQSGIQADIQTIAALGGHALTAVTCISDFALPSEVVLAQVSSIISTFHPKAIKVGLVTDAETIRLLRNEVIATRRLVVAPGIFDADGKQMIDDEAIKAIARYLVPEALLLMLRCKDAEKLLGLSIKTDDDMLEAAKQLRDMGAEWVLLRGGQHTKGRLTALLFGPEKDNVQSSMFNVQWFSSYNTQGWQKHGVSGALSAAITVRLGMGDDVPTAIRNAHDFIHSQVVYAKDTDEKSRRSIDLYNAFVSLVAEHYREAHDVSFYADKLCITTRYLSQITDNVVGKSPKQIIADYLMSEAKSYLETSRLTIQEITDKLGFSSQALFCKFFKNQANASPTEYRSRL